MPRRIGPSPVGEQMLDMGAQGAGQRNQTFVARGTDPIFAFPPTTPADFAAQFPTPLDPVEIMEMCEEISLLRAIPEETTGLQTEIYREMDELLFSGGFRGNLTFPDGECPEPFTHDGDNETVDLKNIGAYSALTISDIIHSAAVRFGGCGIGQIVGGFPAGDGLPGGSDAVTIYRENIADAKEKEMRLMGSLVLNGWDWLLVMGDASTYPNEFDGIYELLPSSCVHWDSTTSSGSFSAQHFDRFLSESCAKPTALFGHPQALQEMMMGYFQLGYQGSQIVNFSSGNRIVPGFNFASFVNTGVGTLAVVADNNFRRQDLGDGTFESDIFALRMTHNGERLVYRVTQIPLSFKDLAPGCTAIAFQIWAKTALIIKACCAQGRYVTRFTGNITTTCALIGT